MICVCAALNVPGGGGGGYAVVHRRPFFLLFWNFSSKAIHAYTQETPIYKTLNTHLRDRKREKLKPMFSYVKLVASGLHRIPSEACTL
jgi:hypothetical protein